MPALNLDNLDDRAKAEAAASKINTAIDDVKTDMPEVPYPPDDFVELNGSKIGDQFVNTAVVQELTGEHEEALARAIQTNNMFHFMDVLLQCGVKQLGDLGPAETKRTLKELLVGDRDELVLAIRRVTYGEDLEILEWICPQCGRQADITLHLDEADQVKRVKLDRPQDTAFEVDLLKGGSAHVHFNTGADQAAIFDDASLTDAERNTVLLSRIVETITDEHGRLHVIAAEPSYVRRMRLRDRHEILKKLSELRPGPRYNEIEFEHEECGNEVTLALGVRDLFRDLLLFL